MATKTKKRGRPVTTEWKRAKWRTATNKEISTALGVSVPAVFNKRKALILKAEMTGKDSSKYCCKKSPYTREGQKDTKKNLAAKK